MTHDERTMTMPTWPVHFDGVSTAVKSAPLLGEHTDEVLADWLGLDAAARTRSGSVEQPYTDRRPRGRGKSRS
jgi:crotonobetainyl-CoA:carnitine CoA-transferase CaiB-like acyl-CoA transferase